MRLETVSKDLASKILNSPEPSNIATRVFWNIAKLLDPEDFALLGDNELAEQLENGTLPSSRDFAVIRDRMDEKYFDSEDEGELELSGKYFALARLMSSLQFLTESRTPDGFCDAVYEAIMSTVDPKKTVQNLAWI